MSNQNLAIIILAAGQGKRMQIPGHENSLPKVMHELAGKPMISILLDRLQKLKASKTIIVTAPHMGDLRDFVAPHETAVQEQQNGTGDAARAALPNLDGFDGRILILMGDEPLVDIDVLKSMAESGQPSVMGIEVDDPSGLGRLVMDGESLQAIVEDKDCTPEQREINICNAGNFALDSGDLKNWLSQIENNNAQGEYYLTDIVEIAAKDGQSFKVFTQKISHGWGVNDRVQLAEHEALYQDILRAQHIRVGVIMSAPDTVHFYHDTVIGAGTKIDPYVVFGPDVKIAENVHIKSFCHLEDCEVRANVTLGPYARLRPGAHIQENAKLGNFVEIKKSVIGKDSKIPHLSYVGDASVGENVNFGAGAITVNYDGYNKHKTVIGDNAKVGSNANLVAPITIGDDAYIAAGSTLSKDVPAGALAIERGSETHKEGWAAKFRQRIEALLQKKAS